MNRNGYLVSMLFVSVSLLLPGCGPKDLSEVDLPIPAESETMSEKEQRTLTVKVANTEVEESPAERISSLPAPDAAPEVVCHRFIQELNRENPDQFRLLLTSAAISVSQQVAI